MCTQCFEEQRGTGGSYLLKKTCLKRKEHRGGPSVSVRLTKEDALEPVIRPMPRVYFKGKFRFCSGRGCRGLEDCTFPHCDKERDAWNAEKFSVYLPFEGYISTRIFYMHGLQSYCFAHDCTLHCSPYCPFNSTAIRGPSVSASVSHLQV